MYGYTESKLIERAACAFTCPEAPRRSLEDLRQRERSQAVTLFDLVPGGESPLAEIALSAFYLRTQSGVVDLFDFVEEAFHAIVGMNQVGKDFTQVAFVTLGEFAQDPIGLFVNFDLP
jgi:hypothetical protein